MPPIVFPNVSTVMGKRRSAHQLRIDTFHDKIHEATGTPAEPAVPMIPIPSVVLSRCRLILEEALEVFDACGIALYLAGSWDRDQRVTMKHALLYLDRSVQENDLPHIAKELADLSVVTTGTFSHFGISDVSVLEEVDANNLAKFGPGGYLDENRKWRKPPNHPVPDIGAVLMTQGWVLPEVGNEAQNEVVPV